MRHSRRCLASDPRDKVYAFLGLADKAYAICPDYATENTIVHELINTARKIIKHEGTLNVLYSVSRGRQRLGSFLPTWVPDWTSAEKACNLLQYCDLLRKDDDDKKAFSASGNLPFQTEYRRDEMDDTMVELKVTGFVVDILDELDEVNQTYQNLQWFRTAHGKAVVTSKTGLIDDEVWVLHGASMPFILRPEGDDKYSVVKEALILEEDGLISNLMFGQGDKQGEHREKTRNIWLI